MDDIKPTRIDENTVEFLGIRFVTKQPTQEEKAMQEAAKTVEKPTKKARVKLVGQDGNVFNLIGICRVAGRKAGYTKEQMDAFMADVTSGDYDHALCAMGDWFDVR